MRMMPILDPLLQVQRGHLLAWVPVFLGLGIGVFFALPVEPGTLAYLCALGVGGLCAGLSLRGSTSGLLARAVLLCVVGFMAAGWRSHSVAASVLGFRYYGPVEGRVVHIDRSARDMLRLTLDQVRLKQVSPDRTPARVRISVPVDSGLPPPGARVATTAHLMPPQGPAEPGGFDFRRHAWFLQLGANGYTRVAVLTLDPGPPGLTLAGLRRDLSLALRQRLPGETGAIAAAITTGDRSGVGQGTLGDLRASNLAHLLAISGLHMGLVAGFVFAALRFTFCLVPPIALRLNVKKLSAAAALLAASGYLALSGGNVATERAFIMVAVMFAAVLLDRRAISLRAVAIAAVLVLLRRPETLLSPGFQMSFAATAALVGVFGWVRDDGITLGPRWLRPVAALVLSSLVAGLATAPFGAAHFNTLSHYGLLANLLAVPVMGLVVVPAAVLSFCLLPLGLQGLGLAAMGAGIDWILTVARAVADLPGAEGTVMQPGPWVLPLLSVGGLFLLIWLGRLRLLGVLPVALAFALWSQATRPLALISSNGGLVGVMGPEGRALSRSKGQGFAARVWLENDGDPVKQAVAAKRWRPQDNDRNLRRARVGPYSLVHAVGSRAAERLTSCAEREILVSTVDLKPEGGCIILGLQQLRRMGSIVIDQQGKLTTARDLSGQRIWTR
ncbi:ComEC/Rec2 family competence protein [Phaeobacter sp. CAU 1743]|uniref:ComEC/Rec2 family competence protein n=1 Tax=Phaeobacter sp. CAU 1743 TaxID=3140367 RepID=UPI0023B6DDAF